MNRLIIASSALVATLAGCSTAQQTSIAQLTNINAKVTQTNADLVKAAVATGLVPADKAVSAVLATSVIAIGAKIVASDAASDASGAK